MPKNYNPYTIRPKAMCIFERDGFMLASLGYDRVKDEHFYRLFGGSIEYGETSTQAIKREIKEELGCKVLNLKYVGIIENIFTFNGRLGHQIAFLYQGDLSNKRLYHKTGLHIKEKDYEFKAEWIPVADVISGKKIVYPPYDYKSVFGKK